MFIINPLHAHRHDNLFATHPKTANRVAALERMVGPGGPKQMPGKSALRSPVPNIRTR